MINGIEIIAEVKTKSPFGWESERTWDDLFEIADSVGDIISIHTDARWGGSFDLLKKARQKTNKPILAKGIHAQDTEIKRALELGATWILVVGRLPKIHLGHCLIEPLSLAELVRLPVEVRAVWNSRDLSNGSLKQETFEAARKAFHGWLCQASNIKTRADIKPGANAILVGSHLEEFAKSL